MQTELTGQKAEEGSVSDGEKDISCCRRPILTSFDPQVSQKEELCVGSGGGGGGGVFFYGGERGDLRDDTAEWWWWWWR